MNTLDPEVRPLLDESLRQYKELLYTNNSNNLDRLSGGHSGGQADLRGPLEVPNGPLNNSKGDKELDQKKAQGAIHLGPQCPACSGPLLELGKQSRCPRCGFIVCAECC